VVAVKLTRCRRSNCSETALGAACEHGPEAQAITPSARSSSISASE
jgi:hypothetical protein